MTTLVCIDTNTGALRSYIKSARQPVALTYRDGRMVVEHKPRVTRVGEARITPWFTLPTAERVFDVVAIEAFRVRIPPTATPTAPEVA